MGPELEAPQPEHSRQQALLGNQAVMDILSSGGGIDIEVPELAIRHDSDKESGQFGGEDEPIDDGPLTSLELTRSWNPGTKKITDRTAFAEPMPDDDLPPEDEAFVRRVRGLPLGAPLPPAQGLDALVQPSTRVVAASLAAWARGVETWTDGSLLHRAAFRAFAPSAPFLQDPHGSVLIARARVGALGTWLLLDCPVLASGANVATAALVDFCLELHGRQGVVQDVRVDAASHKGLPVAAEILAERLQSEAHGHVRAEPPEGPVADALLRTLTWLLDFEELAGLIPKLDAPEPNGPDPDDPLGLDAILEEMTGGPVDIPAAATYQAALLGAERLANASASTRVQFAGTGLAIADVARLWSSGAPVANLLHAMSLIDREVQRCLQLLVEIGRACKGRTVPPAGLHNGLRRAARAIDGVRSGGRDLLSGIVAGILPPGAVVPPLDFDEPDDPLSQAWADGLPGDAVPWLQSLPDSLDRDAAVVFTRAAAGADAASLLPQLDALEKRAEAMGRPAIARMASVCRGPCLLATERLDEALDLAHAGIEIGTTRRNGMTLAEAALLGIEALHRKGDGAGADDLRLHAGQRLWHMGADAGLTLLARWAPPSSEPEEDAVQAAGV